LNLEFLIFNYVERRLISERSNFKMAKNDSGFSHLRDGRAHMVNVMDKEPTRRMAIAAATVRMGRDTFDRLVAGNVQKGDVLATARLAGIQAAKRTSELIPLCHPLQITSINIDFDLERTPGEVYIMATVWAIDRTGVEMEALTAVAGAALTVYDMCKSLDRGMTIDHVHLLEKNGGASGHYQYGEKDIHL